MTEPTLTTTDEANQHETNVDARGNSTDSNSPAQDLSPRIVPVASDISGHVALLMASSAVAVAIFLIFLVAKAASSA